MLSSQHPAYPSALRTFSFAGLRDLATHHLHLHHILLLDVAHRRLLSEPLQTLTFAHGNGETCDALSSCALMYDFAPRMASASLEADAIAFAFGLSVLAVPSCTCVCPAQVRVFGQIVCALR